MKHIRNYIIFMLVPVLFIFLVEYFFSSQKPPEIAQKNSLLLTLRHIPLEGAEGYTEIPPWQITDMESLFFLTSNHTLGCHTKKSLIIGSFTFDKENCVLLTQSEIRQNAHQDTSFIPFKKNYHGIFSAHIVSQGRNKMLLTFAQGENKNEIIKDTLFQNTVNKNVKVQNCASKYIGTLYQDCWDAYFSFITMSSSPIISIPSITNTTIRENHRLIVWPAMGYTNQGKKTSNGVRHPSTIIHDDYVYVFYLDTSSSREEGRKHCIKVARSEMTQGVPGVFKTMYGKKFEHLALPSGFTIKDIQAFYSQKGPLSDCVIDDSEGTIRFSVAKINNTKYFLGIEEHVHGKEGWRLGFRVSKDLITWSKRYIIYTKPGAWSDGDIHFPIFLDKNGKENTTIDKEDFYILGTTTDGKIQRMHVENLSF